MLNDVASPEGADAGARDINRRTIAKGVAWTVPVIMIATAAPAAAASGNAATPSTVRLVADELGSISVFFSSVTGTPTVQITGVTGLNVASFDSASRPVAAGGTTFSLTRSNNGNFTGTVTVTFQVAGDVPTNYKAVFTYSRSKGAQTVSAQAA